MKKNLFLILIVTLFSSGAFAQTTLYSNNFTSGSSGWSFTGGNSWGDLFTVNSVYNCSTPTPNNGGGNYLHVATDPDLVGEACAYAQYSVSGSAGTSYANMTSDFSTIGYSTVTISFSWLCKGSTGGGFFDPMYGAVEYSTNSGGNWTRFTSPRTQYISQSTWTSTTISSDNVPGILNQTKLRLRFVWVNSGIATGGDPNPAFAIDDIVITGTEAVTCDLTTTILNTSVACEGGSAIALPSGGTSPYTYLWSNSLTTEGIANLSAGIYFVTVKDANGCSATESVQITQPQAIELITGVNNGTCGNANGSIDLTVVGGTAPYTYLWSNSAVTQDIVNLLAGSYTVTVTDQNGCTSTTTKSVSNSAGPSLSTSETEVACNGSASGSIDLIVNEGTAPFTYHWSNGASTEDINGLSAGAYEVTVTDANGCTATTGTGISQPPSLSLVLTPSNILCNGGLNGSIQLDVVGGTPSFTYKWSNNATAQNLSNLVAGIYVVTVTDNNGCTAANEATVSEPAVLSAIETHTDVGCGNTDGSIDMTVTGGATPYTYLWSNSETTEDLDNLAPNKYLVDITDANGCTASLEVSVIQLSGSCTVPTGITIENITSSSAFISWTTQPCVYRFQIRYRPTGSLTWATSNIGIGVNSKSVGGLTAATEYEVQVRANCNPVSADFTKWSSSQIFTTDFPCVPPTGVTASNFRKTKTTVSWDAVPAAYSYEIRYRKTGTTPWSRRSTLAPATAKVLIGLTAATEYEYQVRTICDVSGKPASAWSAPETFNTHLRLEEITSSVEDGLMIYPNPNNGNFTVEISNSKDELVTIALYNMLGQVVFSKEINAEQGVNTFNMNIPNLTSGLYTISVKTGEENRVSKIFIQQ